MVAVLNNDASTAAIRDAIIAALHPVRISRVDASTGQDHDGEDIFRVAVVFETDNPVVDGEKLLAASVRVQSALDAIGDSRLAIIDFLNASEGGLAAQ